MRDTREACRTYALAWKEGRRPLIEDFLEGVEGEERSQRIRELLLLEVDMRERLGERPQKGDYVGRFPEHAGLLEARAPESGNSTCDLTLHDPPAPIEAPGNIGKYRILGRLGQPGGQASVYRGWDPVLEKEVALKLGRWQVPAGSSERDHLVREGRTLARIEHPGIGRLVDLVFHEDRPCLVLELVKGRSLEQAAEDSKPSPRQAARIVASVARAVEHLHSQGVVHRDIKPANIVLDESGEPRLIDLGIAQVRNVLRDDTVLKGEVAGTIPFMAPEQARGEVAGSRPPCDVFQLGAVLYYLLTGRAPFAPLEGGIDEAMERARRGDFDRAALAGAVVPRRLARICIRAMAPEPGSRHPGAGRLASELEAFAGGRIAWAWVAALAFSLIAAIALVAWLWQPEPPYGLVSCRFGRDDFSLGPEHAPPLHTGDSLMLAWRIPAGLQATLFWLDTEGKLHREAAGIEEETSSATTVRYPAGPGKYELLAGEPGTEVIFLCARRGDPLSREEGERLLTAVPWPTLPSRTLLHFDRERAWVESNGEAEGETRGPGGETAAPARAALSRAEELRTRLREHCEFLRGIAIPHVR